MFTFVSKEKLKEKQALEPRDEVPQIGTAIEERKKAVTIYRPGAKPEWADETDDSVLASEPQRHDAVDRRPKPKSSGPKELKYVKPSERRPVQAEVIKAEEYAEVPLVVPAPEESKVVDDEDDADARRERARRKREQKLKEEEEAAKKQQQLVQMEDEAAKKQEEDEASEYETDTDAEDEQQAVARERYKPVFVARDDRKSLEELDRLEKEEQELQKAAEARLSERKHESKEMLKSELRKEEELKKKMAKKAAFGMDVDSDEEMPDDADPEDDEGVALEVEKWKLRELKRIKRDREERAKFEKEKEDIERRRNMTDQEILEDNKKLPAKPEKDKEKYRFLQKYYHAGSFYVDEEEDVFKRDFSAPTGQDRTVDRTLLPKVLQVKKFGLKGRTKYTHLVDQDTTKHDANPWFAPERSLNSQGQSKLNGNAPFNPAALPPPPPAPLPYDASEYQSKGPPPAAIAGNAKFDELVKKRKLAGTGAVGPAAGGKKSTAPNK